MALYPMSRVQALMGITRPLPLWGSTGIIGLRKRAPQMAVWCWEAKMVPRKPRWSWNEEPGALGITYSPKLPTHSLGSLSTAQRSFNA